MSLPEPVVMDRGAFSVEVLSPVASIVALPVSSEALIVFSWAKVVPVAKLTFSLPANVMV